MKKFFLVIIFGIIYLGFVSFIVTHVFFRWLYIVLNVIAIILYAIYFRFTFDKNTSIQKKLEAYHFVDSYAYLLFPFPFLFLKVFHYFKKIKLRNKPVYSKSGKKMSKVHPKYDYKFLNKAQQLEQELKSIDYDVWITKGLKENQIIPIPNLDSPHLICDKCNYKTQVLTYDKEISIATYSKDGEGEKKYECKNCGHITIQTYVIDMLVFNDSGDDSYSGGGSSSSGSSWGGGGSSGGGSSSGW